MPLNLHAAAKFSNLLKDFARPAVTTSLVPRYMRYSSVCLQFLLCSTADERRQIAAKITFRADALTGADGPALEGRAYYRRPCKTVSSFVRLGGGTRSKTGVPCACHGVESDRKPFLPVQFFSWWLLLQRHILLEHSSSGVSSLRFLRGQNPPEVCLSQCPEQRRWTSSFL
jgi:hypothetical protein